MAMFGITNNTLNAPRLTDEGVRNFHMPTLDPATPLLKFTLPGCKGCTKILSHGPCYAAGFRPQYGEHRYERVPEEYHPTIKQLNDIQKSIFYLDWVANGLIGDNILFNAGWTANNASQTVGYLVNSVSGASINVTGPNPKRIALSRSIPNPEFPFGPRLLTEGFEICLPVGSSVEFQQPSIYAGRLFPLVVDIEDIASDDEEVTFDIFLNQDVTNAMSPYDLAYPSDEYRILVRFEAISPSRWYNFQSHKDGNFSPNTATFTTALKQELLDTEGNPTRILYPQMKVGAVKLTVLGGTDVGRTFGGEEIKARLETIQTVGGWSTLLDLRDLDFTSVQVQYWSESTAIDTVLLPFQVSCSNSQVYYEGTYGHDGDRACTARDTASQFDTYRAYCYQPDCSKFSISVGGKGYGDKVTQPDNLDQSFFNLWTRTNWVLRQGIPGVSHYSAFTLEKRDGPSIHSLLGGWSNSVPQGFFAFNEEFNGPVFGQRETYTYDDGERQLLVNGAYFAQPIYVEGEIDLRHTMGDTTPEEGLLPALVTGWKTRKDARGNNKVNGYEYYPDRDTSHTNLYTYRTTTGSQKIACEIMTDAEAYLTDMDLQGELNWTGPSIDLYIEVQKIFGL